MQTMAGRKSFATMTSRQMFSLWWNERWVRTLVLMLTPIGLIDAVYTYLLFHTFGMSYEYNPLVRMALTSDFWFVWFIVNVTSFSVFAMIAGSYYLHTRSSIFDSRVGWLSGIVAFRVGLAIYNVLLFYDLAPAFLGGLATTIVTYLVANKLLNRTTDVSWAGFKGYWRAKYDRLHDRFLLRGLSEKSEIEVDTVMTDEEVKPQTGISRVWVKRTAYLVLALMIFFLTPFALGIVAEVTGVGSFTDIYGPLVFWNELSGTGFLVGFGVIIIMIAVIMLLILKAFSVEEGAW
ncbi:MAG: hypothetical protein RTU09_04060 [Candidatus Thorarchaeota archaeon]